MIIAVDFDGTIVEHRYPAIGPEKPGAIRVLRQLAAEGHRLILWTVREGEPLDDAVAFCRSKGLHFDSINSNTPQNAVMDGYKPLPGKVKADVYIDDRNLGGLPPWDDIYEQISRKSLQQRSRSGRKGLWARLFGRK